MTDVRHPKQYPRGSKYPKLHVSPTWKRLVDEALAHNLRSGRAPSSRAELARMIGADKGGLGRMLDGDQPTYKYAKPICDVLGIEPATIENPRVLQIEQDELDRAIADVRALPKSAHLRAARMIRAWLDEPT